MVWFALGFAEGRKTHDTMWACRWFLRRPRAVLSQLHPVRRHAIEPPAGKGKSSTASGGRDRPGCRNRHKKHLYLVLDDAKDGAGIHKLDMDAAAGDVQRLPEPPLVRIGYQKVKNFSVLGRHVIGTGCSNRQSYCDTRGDGDTVTFDTKTSELAVLPDLPIEICNSTAIVAVAIGNMLYVIDNGSALDRRLFIDGDYCLGGLHCLRLQNEDGEQPSSRSNNRAGWDWETSLDDGYSPTRWRWSARHRPLPLSSYDIRANALHPNGRAFYVSVWSTRLPLSSYCNQGTFSYSTEKGRWACHGDWELPFVGQAHYHTGLRAWVGLHGGEGYEPDGYLCSCDVPHLGRRRARAAPGWKLGKERLFLEDPERHIDAKLVDMGGGRFCLVEMLTREGVSWEERLGDGEKCVLRLTTFGVEYGDDGELTTTSCRPARSYKLSSHRGGFHWQAFWA